MFKRILIFVSMLGLACGCVSTTATIQPVDTNVKADRSNKKVTITDMERVAILPLADYTKGQLFIKGPRQSINRKIMEEIADALNARGITVANQEDVNGMLMQEGIINILKNSDDLSSPEWELQNKPHSKIMRANMAHMMSQDTAGEFSENKVLEGVSTGLSREKVKEIGSKLGVDKILRGRILEYGFAETKSLSPFNGFLPVVFGNIVEGSGAFVYQETYETGLPKESWINSKYVFDNEMGNGPGINIPSKQISCYVQIRLYLQDVKDGKILWTNRVEIKYTPPSTLAYEDNHPKKMTDDSVYGGVTLLMEDLFKDKEPPKKILGIF